MRASCSDEMRCAYHASGGSLLLGCGGDVSHAGMADPPPTKSAAASTSVVDDEVVYPCDPPDMMRGKVERRRTREKEESALYMLARLEISLPGGLRTESGAAVDPEKLALAKREVQAYQWEFVAVTDNSRYELAGATLSALGALWAAT